MLIAAQVAAAGNRRPGVIITGTAATPAPSATNMDRMRR